MRKQQPELIKETEEIERTLLQFSAKHAKSINEDIKTKLLNQLFIAKSINLSYSYIMPLNNNNQFSIILYKIGNVVSFLIAGFSVFYIVTQKSIINNTQNDLILAKSNNDKLNFVLKEKQDSLLIINERYLILSNHNTKTIALKGMNSLINHNALVHWNKTTDEIFFNAAIIPKNNGSTQYQLWAIVDGKPIDVGVIVLNDIAIFQKMKSVKGAQAFAVTIEKFGGSDTPNLSTMCLLGNID